MLFGLTIPFLHERGFAAQAPEGAGLPLTDQAIIFPDKKTMPDNFLLLNLLFLKPSASAGAFLQKPAKIHLSNVLILYFT